MPELPEVETTIRGLQERVLGRTIFNAWTDSKKQIKKPKDFEQFKKEIRGRKIEKIWRRGKNILFDLSGDKTLLLHQKLTGHLLIGHWSLVNGNWKPKEKGFLEEKVNTYVHLMFWLSGDLMLALSDLRKFAKIELWNKETLKKELSSLGPEPLDESFTFEKFKEVLQGRRAKIKQALMDQKVVAGIGNIYSDEILWQAKVNPFKKTNELGETDLKKIYRAMKKILKRAIELGGESISDYRDVEGKRGSFDRARKVYQREGEKCSRCGKPIKRKKMAGRSAHFCPKCQKLQNS